jgi:malate dehydrogenase
LAVDDYSRSMMDKTLAELQEEQAGVADLLG